MSRFTNVMRQMPLVGSLLHPTNDVKADLQLWHMTVFAFASTGVFDPSRSKLEVGADLGSHIASIWSLRNDDASSNAAGIIANAFRVGAIFQGVTSGSSTVELPLNIIDSVTHSATVFECVSQSATWGDFVADLMGQGHSHSE